MRICLTGGIACGKSLFAGFLRKLGVQTLDADDVVHNLIPPNERRRLAATVFHDAAARRALEARIHPLVRTEMANWHAKTLEKDSPSFAVEIIPLLFEVHWESDYDTIAAIVSPPEIQIRRMMATRGHTRAEAEARIAAQMPVEEKAARAHYVIRNNFTPEQLEIEAHRFVSWLCDRQTCFTQAKG